MSQLLSSIKKLLPGKSKGLEEYHLAFRASARFQGILTLPGVAGAALFAPPAVKALMMLIASGRVACSYGLGGILVATFLPVRADAHELRGRSVWWLPAHIRWDEITGAEPIWWWGAPFLRLSSAQKRRFLWLPLFLKRQDDFERIVAQWTEPDNPIRLYFETRESQKPPTLLAPVPAKDAQGDSLANLGVENS